MSGKAVLATLKSGAPPAPLTFLGGRARALAQYLALPAAGLAIWQTASSLGYIAPYALPSPWLILRTGVESVADFSLPRDILVSLGRVVGGFILAALAALALGIVTALSTRFETYTRCLFQVLKPIPPIAWIPIAILWLGIGESSKLFIIFIGAFFPVFINTVSGIRHIDPRYVEVARVLEIPYGKFVKTVVLPGALPVILSGLRIGLNSAWICVVAAEMIAATSGIGYLLMDGRQLAQPDKVILAMLVVGVIGKITDDLVARLETGLVRW